MPTEKFFMSVGQGVKTRAFALLPNIARRMDLKETLGAPFPAEMRARRTGFAAIFTLQAPAGASRGGLRFFFFRSVNILT
jgi:hypothetical protein